MALNTVNLTFTEQDSGGGATTGPVVISPTSLVTAAGQTVVSQAPIIRQFSGGTVTVTLIATDNAGTSPPAGFWAYNIQLPGQAVPATYLVAFASGASQQFSNLTPAIAQTTYGPAATGGTPLVMTTLGDIIYENAAPTAARLPGNTTTTRNFLTQAGTGTVSAAPAWGTIAVTDIPSLTTTFSFGSTGAAPSSGTFVAGQVVTDQNGVVRVCTAGGSPGTWARAGQQPHQFWADDYGALGNGKIFTDGVTNGTTTFTSATAGFASADTGKHIMVNGGNGAASAPVLTTITFSNATTVTLGSAAGASATACAFVYGTDDTAAINNCISAASTYAQASNFMAEVIFSAKIYVSTTLTQQNNSPAVYNTQLLIPFPAGSGQTRKLMVTLRGAGYMAPAQYWESIQPNVQGSAVVSMLTAPSTQDATFLQQSVIGGPSGTAGFTGTFANTHLTIAGLSVWCPAYTNIKALDMGVLSGCYLDGYSSNIFAPANNLAGASAAHPYLADFPAQGAFQSTIGVGILFPRGGNNDSVAFTSICVEGYEVGIDLLDHATGLRYAGLYCDVIMRCPNVGQSHEVAIQSVSAEVYNGGIRVTGSGGSILRLNVGWDGEAASVTYDVSDTSNIATGQVRWYDLDRTTPTVSGASALKVINERLGPGHMASPPSVPASTSSAALVYRDAWVTIHTGVGVTVSAVTIDGTATGLTMAASSSLAVLVPAGKTIALTYAGGTPAWDWWLT